MSEKINVPEFLAELDRLFAEKEKAENLRTEKRVGLNVLESNISNPFTLFKFQFYPHKLLRPQTIFPKHL